MSGIPIDPYVLDTLMVDLVGHDRQPSAYLVYLYLWRWTRGTGEAVIQVSLHDIGAGTGLSRRSVQAAIGQLSKRGLIEVSRASVTAVPVYEVRRPWRR